MNAAAKAIHQSNLFSGQWSAIELSRSLRMTMILCLMVFASALAVIYTTNEYRLGFNALQQLKQEKQVLDLQWGQLLLERASVATPARIEALAVNKLHMHVPSHSQLLVLGKE